MTKHEIPSEDQVAEAERVLRDRVARLLATILNAPPEALPHIREWVNAANLADVCEFDLGLGRNEASTVAVPLFFMDMVFAELIRDGVIDERRALEEYDVVKPTVKAYWNLALDSGAKTEYPVFSIEVDGQDVPLPDFFSDAIDVVAAWLKRS
jgi:hypothetical protein